MGHKVNPVGMRLGIVSSWSSAWYAPKQQYRDYLLTDLRVRDYLMKALGKKASVSRVQIERRANNVVVVLHSARPGIVIGKKGEDIEALRKELGKRMNAPVKVQVEEIRKPELDARLVADSVAQQIERRIMFRRAMKRAITNTMRLGAAGIKIAVSGRLNGAEIARSEWYREGRIPLHTLRAEIDYSCVEANTTYGVIGVKVWILKSAGAAADDAAKGDAGDKKKAGRDPSAKKAGKGTGADKDAATEGKETGADKVAATEDNETDAVKAAATKDQEIGAPPATEGKQQEPAPVQAAATEDQETGAAKAAATKDNEPDAAPAATDAAKSAAPEDKETAPAKKSKVAKKSKASKAAKTAKAAKTTKATKTAKAAPKRKKAGVAASKSASSKKKAADAAEEKPGGDD